MWKNYDPTLHEWLLKLTEAFDLTFPIPVAKEAEKFNIVPCLLPEKEPADVSNLFFELDVIMDVISVQ